MKVVDLRQAFGVKNNAQLAKKLQIGRSTLTGWENDGIPPYTQATLEILLNGKVKADRISLIGVFSRGKLQDPQALVA